MANYCHPIVRHLMEEISVSGNHVQEKVIRIIIVSSPTTFKAI